MGTASGVADHKELEEGMSWSGKGWDTWVIDASMGYRDGMFTFCPIEGDLMGEHSIVIGMNVISDTLPTDRDVVAIVHEDGQKAVEEFCCQYESELDALAKSKPDA